MIFQGIIGCAIVFCQIALAKRCLSDYSVSEQGLP